VTRGGKDTRRGEKVERVEADAAEETSRGGAQPEVERGSEGVGLSEQRGDDRGASNGQVPGKPRYANDAASAACTGERR